MSAQHARFRRRLWIASIAVLACTALGIGLFLNAYSSLVTTSFLDRTKAYGEAFAASVDSWLARGQSDVAESLARLLVAGSVLAVEIVGEDGDLFHAGVELAALPEGAYRAATVIERRGMVVDVVVPMTSAGGHVRLALDASSCVAARREALLFAVGGGVLFDGGIVGLLAWALRPRRREVREQEVTAEERGDEIVLGDLVIFPARCEAAYAGQPLRLTPKQFALLGVLASDPGRVFSEAEILAAAWPDSAYADARDVKQYVYLLRRRLGAVRPEGRDVIVTVPGFGYRLGDGR